MIIIVAVIIVILWVIAKKYYHVDDNTVLELGRSRPLLITRILEDLGPKTVSYNNPKHDAANILKITLDLNVDPKDIVVVQSYKSSQAKHSDYIKKYTDRYSLRDLVGLDLEIMVFKTKEEHKRQKIYDVISEYDLNELSILIANNVVKDIHDFINELIKHRTGILEKELPGFVDKVEHCFAWVKYDVPNIKMGSNRRVDLLCDGLEFQAFLDRCKKSVPRVQIEEIE